MNLLFLTVKCEFTPAGATISSMDDQEVSNVKALLSIPSGIVILSRYLEDLGITAEDQKRYEAYGWLERIGAGAFKVSNDVITWESAIFALQYQEYLPIHIGAESALALQGHAHYLRLGRPRVFMFSPTRTPLPKWFTGHEWSQPFRVIKADIFSGRSALVPYSHKDVGILISTPERAILECLYLVPKKKAGYDECQYLMEGLFTLRPSVLQNLLDQCHSPKLKRQFWYLAKKNRHAWLERIRI